MGSNPTSSARSLRKCLIYLHNFYLKISSHTLGPNTGITRSTVARVRIKGGRDTATTPTRSNLLIRPRLADCLDTVQKGMIIPFCLVMLPWLYFRRMLQSPSRVRR